MLRVTELGMKLRMGVSPFPCRLQRVCKNPFSSAGFRSKRAHKNECAWSLGRPR